MFGAVGLYGDDAEQGVELGAVPANVIEAAAKAVEGFKAESAVVEAILIYEVEGDVGEKEWELEITADGTIIEQEEDEDEAAEGRDTDDAAEAQQEDDDTDADAEEGDDDEAEDEDGAEHELSLPVSALPAAVIEAAKKAVEGIELEEGGVESVLVYELSGKAVGREVEIEVTAEGDVLEIERD
jgi:hypothetical protein